MYVTTYQRNKIEGTPILKLAMVKRLKVKINLQTNQNPNNSVKNFVKKICQKNLSKDSSKIRHKNSSQRFVTKIRYKKEPQGIFKNELRTKRT